MDPVPFKVNVTRENHRFKLGKAVDAPGATAENFIFLRSTKIEMSASVRFSAAKNVLDAKTVFMSSGSPSNSPFPATHAV